MDFISKLFIATSDIIEVIVPATIIYCLILVVRRFSHASPRPLSKAQYLFGFFLSVYGMLVGRITGVILFWKWQFGQTFNYNLIIFENTTTNQLLLNIVLFIPLGMLVPLTFSKSKWNFIKMFFVVFLTALFIELTQLLFAGRVFDINDLLSNTFGGVMGYLFYQIIHSTFQRNAKKSSPQNWLSILLNFIAILWYLPFQRTCLGDLILTGLHLPIWSDNTAQKYAMSGLHYTLFFALLLSILAFILALQGKKDSIGKFARILSVGNFIAVIILLFVR